MEKTSRKHIVLENLQRKEKLENDGFNAEYHMSLENSTDPVVRKLYKM